MYECIHAHTFLFSLREMIKMNNLQIRIQKDNFVHNLQPTMYAD